MGDRKYKFALFCLMAMVAGYAGALLTKTDANLYNEYVFGLFLLMASFGGTNGIEHIAGAVKARYGAIEKPPTDKK
jgi:hypothetical protein